MRFSYLFAVLGMVLDAASPMAQENMPNDRPAAVEWTGPIVEGQHRQPTEADVEALERAKVESWAATQERNPEDEKTVEDLYRELMMQISPGEQNSDSGP